MPVIIICCIVISCLNVKGQKPSGVKGSLEDSSTLLPIRGATIAVIKKSDSSLVFSTMSNDSGYFQMNSLPKGIFNLSISFEGYERLYIPFEIANENTMVEMQGIKMYPVFKVLEEVVVTDNPTIRIKEDTIIYKADSFKTRLNASVEELLKKLPGVQVERDGTVKAQGENVQKVYVDGKEFFGDDPKMATRNLTADMIDRVEVYDDMSEQAKFTQIDDGSRSKAINLRLKKEKKRGFFAKLNAGYGSGERYEAGIIAHVFKGATKVSVIGKTNNINSINLSAFGSGVNVGSLGNSGGVTNSNLAGINYTDTWSPKFDAAGSYSFNSSVNNNNRRSFRQTSLFDSLLKNNQITNSETANYSHKFNYLLTYIIDSFNSLIYKTQVYIQIGNSYSDDSSFMLIQKNGIEYLGNDTRNIINNSSESNTILNNIIWKHKTRKPGRTLIINVNHYKADNGNEGSQMFDLDFYNENGVKTSEINRRQLNIQDNEIKNWGVDVSRTEPISKKGIWELNYSFKNSRNENNRSVLKYNSATNEYDIVDSTQSNHWFNTNYTNRVGSHFHLNKKKYKFQIGFHYQQTKLNGDNISRAINTSKVFSNILPNAVLNYQFEKRKAIRISYMARTILPSIFLLQEVQDFSNPLFIRNGNANLRQEFSNAFTLTYNSFDVKKFRHLNASINFTQTNDKIVDSIGNVGVVQYARPGNLDGIYNLSGLINFGNPIRKLKGSNINLNTRFTFARNGNYLNGLVNYTRNITIGEDIGLKISYRDKVETEIRAAIAYSAINYSKELKAVNQQLKDQSYFTQAYSLFFAYIISNNFILSTDVSYSINPEDGSLIENDFMIWNAAFETRIFKNKNGHIKVSATDLLNQNINFSRSFGENYYEDVYNNVLRSYYMVSFTYDLRAR